MRTLILGLVLCCFSGAQLSAQGFLEGRPFTNHTEVGGLFGNVEYVTNPYGTPKTYGRQNKTNLTIQTFNGLMLTSRLAGGVTLGVDWFNDALINPIALGARYDLISRYNARLFGTLDAGYGFTWFYKNLNGNKLNGGLMLNPGIGWRLGKPGNAGFTIAITYKRQEAIMKMPVDRAILRQEEARQYNRLAVRVGIVF
ncbi:MAG: hypothetical protein ABS46_06860 [Cytophagaceae bacterium SCN 52-12]|nr:MAG: hypothetical protein ABS46_06860 [Cytophagaceae bacterium SCN 52-12]